MFYIVVYEANQQRKTLIHLCLRKVIFQYNLVCDVIWLDSIPSTESINKYFPLVKVALVSLDGLDCGKLSEELYGKNSDCRIIFYSGTQEDVINLLHTRPIGFCPCDNSIAAEPELHQALNRVVSELSSTSGIVSMENKNGLYLIPKSQILYFQSDLKNVNVYSLGMPVISVTKKLTSIQQELAQGSHKDVFIRIHQSYLVNRAHIAYLDKSGHRLILSSGEDLPISDSRYSAVYNCCQRHPKNDC